MPKIKIHNLFHIPDQVLFTVRLDAKKKIFLPSVLNAFREEDVAIPFILQSSDRQGNFILSLAAAQKNLDWVRAAFQEGLDLSLEDFEVKKDVVLIALYGPHFGEIPGIASRLFSNLAKDGVEVLAFSASLNSSLLVIPVAALDSSLRSLNRLFEIPKK